VVQAHHFQDLTRHCSVADADDHYQPSAAMNFIDRLKQHRGFPFVFQLSLTLKPPDWLEKVSTKSKAPRRAALALELVRNQNVKSELNDQETPATEIRELKKEASRGRLYFE
jgi:hypothetical protein